MALQRQSIPTPPERAAQLARDHREFVRRTRRSWLARISGIVVALGAGLVIMGWSAHTTDPSIGAIAFWSGLLVGNGGMLLVLLASYFRAVDRGDV